MVMVVKWCGFVTQYPLPIHLSDVGITIFEFRTSVFSIVIWGLYQLQMLHINFIKIKIKPVGQTPMKRSPLSYLCWVNVMSISQNTYNIRYYTIYFICNIFSCDITILSFWSVRRRQSRYMKYWIFIGTYLKNYFIWSSLTT